MLYRLEFSNFGPFRDRAVVDLPIRANVPDSGVFAPIGRNDPATDWERAPKIIGFFGANATGKSTVLRALAFLAWFLRSSNSLPAKAPLPFLGFNDKALSSRTSEFAVELTGPEELLPAEPGTFPAQTHRWRYSVAFVPGPEGRQVYRETLERAPAKGRWTTIFERTSGKVDSKWGFWLPKDWAPSPKVSLISALTAFAHPAAAVVAGAAGLIASNLPGFTGLESEQALLKFYFENPPLLEDLRDKLARLDLGIHGFDIDQVAQDHFVGTFTHENQQIPLPLSMASNGTRNLISIFPHLHYTLQSGGVAVIDELDSALHPHLLEEVFHWYSDLRINKHDAALWFSGQNPHALDLMEKEQIFLTAKDRDGASQLTSLKDFQGLRRDRNFAAKYLGGVFGHVPTIG